MSGVMLETGTYLDRILARTAAHLALRTEQTPIAVVEQRASERDRPLGLQHAIARTGTSVIAEFKRASPSRGRFPVEIDPATVATEYIDGGAAAISVLTDEPFFQGSMSDLTAVATVAHERKMPVLRKDFVLDEYQLYEARAIGADAVLLIVAALDQSLLTKLFQKAQHLGLDSLVEVHDEEEMRRAVDIGAEIVGVNNRDLRTFQVDLATTERLAPLLPASAVLVGESGIFTREDVVRLEQCGVHAVLVGESLIVAPNRAAAVRMLRGEE